MENSLLRSGEIAFFEPDIRGYIDKTARNVVEYMIGERLTLSAAESCTGGLIASAVTSVPGASKVFGCGVVSYSVDIKESLLGVPKEIIDRFGVVSAETARAMSERSRIISESDISVAVTGLCGPASPDDPAPVGTVYVSTSCRGGTEAENLKLYELGSFERNINRLPTAAFALEKVMERLKKGF